MIDNCRYLSPSLPSRCRCGFCVGRRSATGSRTGSGSFCTERSKCGVARHGMCDGCGVRRRRRRRRTSDAAAGRIAIFWALFSARQARSSRLSISGWAGRQALYAEWLFAGRRRRKRGRERDGRGAACAIRPSASVRPSIIPLQTAAIMVHKLLTRQARLTPVHYIPIRNGQMQMLGNHSRYCLLQVFKPSTQKE